ncbi:four-helix bundle copper-binding protein [Haloferula sargassicola]
MNTDLSYQACIEACQACAVACAHCASSCLKEDDVKMMADCIATDLDCAELCHLAVSYMARDAAKVREVCRLCAEVCDACGAECGKHEHQHCQECAEACRRCAEACREVAA